MGVDAVFLIDEMDRIVDVTYGSMEAVHRAAELWQKKTPLKGNFEPELSGVILKPLENNTNLPSEPKGAKSNRTKCVRWLRRRLAKLSKGDAVVLLVDDENKVTDVAIPPSSSESDQR